MSLVLAIAALGRREIVRAGLTRIEIRERFRQIVLDHLELRDLLADLRLLLGVQRAHPSCPCPARAGLLELLHEALDLGERDPDRLELDDPLDAIDRFGTVEPEATFGARPRLEQAELFVEMHRANG